MAQMQRKGSKAAAAKTQAAGPNLKGFYLLLALVAVAGLAWIGYNVMYRESSVVAAPVPLTGMEDSQALFKKAQGVVGGSPEATARVLIFSDFTCPACRIFNSQVEPQLRAEYLDRNLVQFVYYDYPIDLSGGDPQHRYGFVAARAARCAGEQGKYWQYHDVLFSRQNDWSFAKSVPVAQFVAYAKLVAIDPAKFESCLRSDQFADVVSANRLLGEKLGVHSTPTIFVGQRAMQNFADYSELKTLLQQELGVAPPK